MAKQMKKIQYFFCGCVERCTRPMKYEWRNAYSEPNGTPMTYRECQQDARAQGGQAQIIRTRYKSGATTTKGADPMKFTLQELKELKNINVQVFEHFDGKGNSYWSGLLFVNGYHLHTEEFQYGYGTHGEDTLMQWLGKELGLAGPRTHSGPYWAYTRWLREHKVVFNTSKAEGLRERAVRQRGEVPAAHSLKEALR